MTPRSISNARSVDSIGARVGFVYKTEDDLIAQYNPGRPISAYTVPYTFVDTGVDGVNGTADDAPSACSACRTPPDVNTRYPLTNVTQNTPRFSRYKTVEASMDKRLSNRWAAQIGGSHTWAHDFPGAYPNNPNGTFDEDNSRWDFKLSGTYEAPYGIRVSPLVRHQAGANFARQISVGAGSATAAGAIFSGTINVEPLSSRRHDNITVFDLRVDRGFNLGGTHARARLRRSVQHHEQQRGRDAHHHDRHGIPAPDRGAPAAHREGRRAVLVLALSSSAVGCRSPHPLLR